MKPTKEQLASIITDVIFSGAETYSEIVERAITEWEKIKEISKQTKEPQVKIPNEKDLEFLAYALPWRLHALLPSKHEDRDILIKEIISLWEKIRSDK